MQTTTFRCGSCGNLMAVSNEYLGQQVQCPTCRQVVVAPNPSPAPAPVPAPAPLPELSLEAPPPPAPIPPPMPTPASAPFPSLSLDTEHESIFSEGTRDDLFDEPGPSMTPAPTVEYRPEPTPLPELEPPPMLEPAPPELEEVPEEPRDPAPVSQRVNWGGRSPEPSPEARTEPEPEDLPRESEERKPRKKQPISWGTLLLLPLVSYAVLSTALILYMWNRMEVLRSSSGGNQLEKLPDIHGDEPGAKQKTVKDWAAPDSLATAALPSGHTLRLGGKVTVGNLEVEALRVERGHAMVQQGNYNPEPTFHETLFLHLRFRNLSKDYSFAPLDNAFDRRWDGNREKVAPLDYRPLTLLKVGSQTFYGGAAHFTPSSATKSFRDKKPPEYVIGPGRAVKSQYLDPGQTMTSFVTTNGEEKQGANIVPATLAHKDDLIWRVHVRQGPVEVPGRSAPVPSTTIIAVSFKASDVARQAKNP